MVTNCRRNIKRYVLNLYQSETGFSMLELLAALVILTIVIFAFTPLFISSMERIHFAGDKSDALFKGEAEIEISLAERQTIDGDELIFTYGENGENEIIVPGGLVGIEVTQGNALSVLGGFIPYVPTINLHLAPLPLIEGYNVSPMIIMGRDTKLENVVEPRKLKILDNQGLLKFEPLFDIIEPPDGVPEDYGTLPERYDQYARFEMPVGLRNADGPFLVEISWLIENDIEVIVRTRFQVLLPYAVATGGGQRIWISPDASQTWRLRQHPGEGGSGTYNDVIWTGYEYIAVSSSGQILAWRNRMPISILAEITDASFKSIVNDGTMYVVVGVNGRVVYSRDKVSWFNSDPSSITGSDLYAVGYSANEGLFAAVGSNGVIFTSPDGNNWEDEWNGLVPEAAQTVTFTGLAYGHSRWLAVGYDAGGAVIYKSGLDGWVRVVDATLDAVSYGLNDIIFDGSRFIAVGNSGTVLKSNDGESWTEIGIGTTDDLHAIDFNRAGEVSSHCVIVGQNGTVVTWTGNIADIPVVQISKLSHTGYGVAVR